MSTILKPIESKKSKNFTHQSSTHNANANNFSKNSKSSFSTNLNINNISNNNNKKSKKEHRNSDQKRHAKKHTLNNLEDKKISIKKKDLSNQENHTNELDIKENYDCNKVEKNLKEENESKKNLNKVDSFKSIEFLLPKKSKIIEKSEKKDINMSNMRLMNQEGYDFDGNNNDSSEKKKLRAQERDSKIRKINFNDDFDDDSYKEEDMDKIKKQEELIKKLLTYKNFQNYIKKILKHKNIGVDKEGNQIKWSLFKKHLYNIAFLDLYYKHRIPFIIMRPILEVIKRKREEKKRQMKGKLVEEEKNNEKENIKNSLEIKEGETTYASILDKNIQNEMEKNGYIIGEDNSTVRIEKRESLFPSKDGKPKGIFTLTKIPQKTDDENLGNIRLKMAFNKAKDAARVVRRLEYSYSMRVNILLSKPIFQKNAKVIQNWYRSMRFIKINTPKIIKIQAFVRGMMIRKAFKEVKNLYSKDLPFIKDIDKILSRRYAKIFFDKIIPRFGIKTLIELAKIKNNKIINALSRFFKKQKIKRENFSASTNYNKKCCYTKEIFDFYTKLKIIKLQAYMRLYYMHTNEKKLLQFSNDYHPNLYYFLKYRKNQEILKNKMKKFRNCFLKMKELKLKMKYKKYNINNKYDYLKYILRKAIFNKIKNYYNNSINNRDINYQKRIKLKILLNHQKKTNNKRTLKRYFNKWNIIANYLSEYRTILKHDKLLLIEIIMKYHKKYKEKIFIFLINSIKEKKIQEEKNALNKMINFYGKHNKIHNKEHINNNMFRAIKIWKKKTKFISIINSVNIINKNAKIFLANKKLKQKQKLNNCLQIRNKVFKEKLALWKFNSGKLKRHYNSFINRTLNIIKMKIKIQALKKNLASLERRKKNILKKYFERFQTNTGVKKLLCIKMQLCLYDENKQVIINDTYSLKKYIKDQYNINKEELKNNITLKAMFNFWKTKTKNNEFKKKCGQRIKSKCESEKNILKLKFIHWYKINRLEKVEKACRIIQNKYRNYKRKKKE